MMVATLLTGCVPRDEVRQENDYPFGALIDLHLHLDGSISIESAKELARLQGMPELSDEELRQRMVAGSECESLDSFLTKFAYPCSLLQTEAGLTRAVNNLLRELSNQGLIYAEIRFAPQKSMEKGLTQEQVVKAALAGLDDNVLPARLILCCMRGPQNEVNALNRQTVEVAKQYLEKGVVGVDLAGAEGLYPTTDYADLFAYAKQLGVPYTIHAGEAEGVLKADKSIQAAMDMGAPRIGHGVLSHKTPSTMLKLADKQIVLEICPTSNVCTKAVPDMKEFPFLTLLKWEVKCCVCTDDMTVCNTTLTGELEKLRRTFGLSRMLTRQLMLNAADASFAPDSLKQRLKDRITTFYDPVK